MEISADGSEEAEVTDEQIGSICAKGLYRQEPLGPASRLEVILASLECAVHLWEHPVQHAGPVYGMGPYGYARLIEAVKAGAGDSHGNWWNATVWSECRSMASAYFAEIADDLPEASTLSQDLSKQYSSIAEGLSRVSDKEMAATEKVALLETIRPEAAALT